MATLYIDLENGNDNHGGTSFDPLASGVDGRITGSTFSSATANFTNNGILANTKNLFAYSENINNANYWSASRTTISTANISPPTEVSSSSIWNILETIDNNTHDIRTVNLNLGVNVNNLYTVSCYVKSNGRSQVVMRYGNTAAKGVRFNIGNGTVAGSGASATGAISDAGNGWYRISLTTTPDSTTDLIYFMLAQDSYTGTTAESYVGDQAKGFYITAPQLEQANAVTSYETPISPQYLSIFNGTSYNTYHIINVISSTSLGLIIVPGGTALANQSVDRQYFIGGRWRTISNGATGVRIAPGDNIRIMASPDPTLVGNATFTSGKANTTLTGISSSTNTSPISITSQSNHGLSTGDTVIITGHATNTNANGTWTVTVTGANTFTLDNSTGNGAGPSGGVIRNISNCVIRLASPVTENIASFGNRGNGRTAWVASANASATLDTSDTKEGDVSDSITAATAFTTGKVAYKSVGSLNLSNYQQISFYIKQVSGNLVVPGDVTLRLCSDTTGDVTVNTITIPATTLTRWIPVTVNLGVNLGSSIQSIALYVEADKGQQNFLLSNIIACKASSSADSLSLQSLIGKNTTNERWWATMQSINGARIILDQETNVTPMAAATLATAAQTRGYSGTSETTSLFKRETIKTSIAVASNTTIQTINDSGSAGNLINFLFGYDRTNMSNRTGQTFMDGLNSWGYGLFGQRSYYSVDNAGFVRYFWGLYTSSSTGVVASNLWFTATSQYSYYILGAYLANLSNIYISFNLAPLFINIGCQKIRCDNIQLLGNSAQAMLISGSANCSLLNSRSENNNVSIALSNAINTFIKNCTCINNAQHGFAITNSCKDNMIVECTTTNNSFSVDGQTFGTTFVKNCSLNEAIPVANFHPYSNGRTIFSNNNSSSNNYIHYTEGGTIYSTSAVRYSNSGFAWALAPTSTVRDSSYPLDLAIAKVAVNANSLVTVRAWMRRSSIALTTGLRIKAEQIAGVPNDITSYMTSPADTWEQVTLSFTPTEAGVVEILAECYGGSTFTAYVDDISITQV